MPTARIAPHPRRARPPSGGRPATAVVGVLVLIVATASTAGAVPVPTEYRPPVDAPVLRPFERPATPYAAGNRGIDYATRAGEPVHTVADGTVVFAGPVAGALHVTVAHPDGLRSSYSFVAEVHVDVGQVVGGGDVLATAGAVLHLGVRDPADRYLDPQELFAHPGRAVLVPGGDDGAPPPTSHERGLLGAVVAEGWSRLGGLVPGLPRPDAGALVDLAALGPAALAHQVWEMSPALHVVRIADEVIDRTLLAGPCTPPSTVPPPPGERRIAVLVAGYGSTSGPSGIDGVDVGALGYAPDDVLRFSYRGGRTPARPTAEGPLAEIGATGYDDRDSQGDLVVAGEALHELLEEVAARAPGVPIDVIAHSQGGVVTRLALAHGDDTGRLPAAVDAVVTLGTPHRGADLATTAASSTTAPTGDGLLEALAALGAPFDPDAPALSQLSEVSPVIESIADAAPPAGVRLTSIGARGDLVVPAGRTRVVGGANVVVPVVGPGAHDELPASAAATREIALARAGLAPTCESVPDVVADVVVADGIAWAEDAFGVALGAGSLLDVPSPSVPVGAPSIAFGPTATAP